ncbi:hypothetical protein D3C86_1631400 [compost metagenome]
MTFLGMDEIWELDRVADEEDRSIVAYKIIISFFGVEFNGKTARVADSISRTKLSGHGREADEHGCTFANFR